MNTRWISENWRNEGDPTTSSSIRLTTSSPPSLVAIAGTFTWSDMMTTPPSLMPVVDSWGVSPTSHRQPSGRIREHPMD